MPDQGEVTRSDSYGCDHDHVADGFDTDQHAQSWGTAENSATMRLPTQLVVMGPQ